MVWTQPKGLKSSAPWACEWCAMGWGVEQCGRGNLGEGLGMQERQGEIIVEGKRRRGGPP